MFRLTPPQIHIPIPINLNLTSTSNVKASNITTTSGTIARSDWGNDISIRVSFGTNGATASRTATRNRGGEIRVPAFI